MWRVASFPSHKATSGDFQRYGGSDCDLTSYNAGTELQRYDVKPLDVVDSGDVASYDITTV